MLNRSCIKILELLLKSEYNNEKINKYNISRKLNLSYTCITENLELLKIKDFVMFIKSGRCVNIELTEDGSKLAKQIVDINNFIENKGKSK